MSKHTIQIELEGLITLLAQNLYADPDVFLREMLQNAHDSITKRRELARERGERAVPSGEIRIALFASAHTLAIIDNGSGLTEAEIHDYLATIGRSGTGELRARLLGQRGPDDPRATAVELIGQFGIGLLSAFIVAERVEVLTRAAGHSGYRWVSTGSREYSVSAAERTSVGTTVTLHLSADKRRYLDRGRIERIVRTYADFLGVPVYVDELEKRPEDGEDGDGGDDGEDGDDGGVAAYRGTAPVNAVDAPWHRAHTGADEQKRVALAYWDQRFPDEVALDVLAVADDFSYLVGDRGRDSAQDSDHPDGPTPRRARVHGVLAITDRHVPDVNTRGTVDVYIARMFICSGNRDILPPWARFIQGVIECDQLMPNAARDNIMRDATLSALMRHLGRRIIDWLTDLSRTDSDRFVRIMRWHSYHILAMAVQDAHEEFFRAVADLVPLTTDRGPLTVPDYLVRAGADETPPPAYYITESGSARQYYMLCAARGLCVFDCGQPFAERFLHRYAALWPERMRLERLDIAHTGVIFQALSNSEREPFAALVAAYGRLFDESGAVDRVTARVTAQVAARIADRVEVKVERFAPAEVPAILTEARDSRSRRQMADLVENPSVPAFLRDMVTDFLDERRAPMTLHLNAENTTVQRFASQISTAMRPEVERVALMTLYNNALMLSGQTLSADRMRAMFAQYNQLIELVIEER